MVNNCRTADKNSPHCYYIHAATLAVAACIASAWCKEGVCLPGNTFLGYG